MLFWKSLRRGSMFLVVMLALATLPAAAQDTTATTEAEWGAASTDATLTLVWQTTFTRETALPSPGDIAIDADGNVYVSTQTANTVKKFDSEGNLVTEWGGPGTDDGQFNLSLGIGVDAESNVYVTDFYNRRIQKFDSEGTFLKQWATEPSTSPAFLAVDAWGTVYIDQFPPQGEHYVAKFDDEGTLLSEWGGEHFDGRIEDIAVDADGNLYVANFQYHRVQKLDADGNLITSFGGEASKDGNGLFDDPLGIAVDGEGYLYVLDRHFLQKLDAEGNFIAQWSTAEGDFMKASNVAVDADGNIYVFAYAEVTAPNGTVVKAPVLKKFQQGGW